MADNHTITVNFFDITNHTLNHTFNHTPPVAEASAPIPQPQGFRVVRVSTRRDADGNVIIDFDGEVG